MVPVINGANFKHDTAVPSQTCLPFRYLLLLLSPILWAQATSISWFHHIPSFFQLACAHSSSEIWKDLSSPLNFFWIILCHALRISIDATSSKISLVIHSSTSAHTTTLLTRLDDIPLFAPVFACTSWCIGHLPWTVRHFMARLHALLDYNRCLWKIIFATNRFIEERN